MTTTTTPFNLNGAKQAAAADSSKKSRLAAGSLGNAVDRIIIMMMDDSNLDDEQRAAILNEARENVLSLFGRGRPSQQEVGGGSDDTSAPVTVRSGDEDGDSTKDLRKAVAAKKVAEENAETMRKALEQVIGSSLQFDRENKLTSDVKAGLDKAIQDAKDSVTPANATALQAKIDAAKTAADKAMTAAGNESTSAIKGSKIEGHDELLEELQKVVDVLS